VKTLSVVSWPRVTCPNNTRNIPSFLCDIQPMLVDSHSLHTQKTTPTNKSTVHTLFCGKGQNQVRCALKYLRPRLREASNLNHTLLVVSATSTAHSVNAD